MKRSKAIKLALLTGMPLMLTSCGGDRAYDRYTRETFPSMEACLEAYRSVPHLPEPCVYEHATYYGPYRYSSGGYWSFFGYSRGKVSGAGVRYLPGQGYALLPNDARAAKALNRASGTARGGFGTTARTGSSWGS